MSVLQNENEKFLCLVMSFANFICLRVGCSTFAYSSDGLMKTTESKFFLKSIAVVLQQERL